MTDQLRTESPNAGDKRSRSSDHSPALSSSSERIPVEDESRIPAFLRLSASEINAKFEDLGNQQEQRFMHGLKSGNGSPWRIDFCDENKALNRYTNIWPWDNSRIKLNTPEGTSNYINASPVSLTTSSSGREMKFVAAQGPKETNVDHFWQMVWQETESTAVIVMLTQLTETMKEKCYQYFPEDANSKPMIVKFTNKDHVQHEGSVRVCSLESNEDCKTTVREILLSYNGTEKKVWHLFFQAWPDFGVPQDTDRNALLNLIKLSREKNRDWGNPSIVHCSAGVGRTGSFIALEHLYEELNSGRFDDMISAQEDPIYDTVSRLREQRMHMVQSDIQYAFLYHSLLVAFQQRLREKEGRMTPLPYSTSSSEKLSHGEPSPKAVRLSRGFRNFITEIRSRSTSRRRDGEINAKSANEEKPPPSPLSRGKIP